MKPSPHLFALSLLCLTACSSAPTSRNEHPSPETVMITYHVKPGREADLEEVLARAWKIYRQEHLVLAQPHTIVEARDPGDKTRFVETFTWVSHEAPDHTPDSVKKTWGEMMALCETRDGHSGLEGGEVVLLVPPIK